MEINFRDNEYIISVMGTVSSGKSTFINALIGEDLLPSGNMATTSKILRIIDNDAFEYFEGKVFGKEINKSFDKIGKEQISIWNENTSINSIEVEGNIKGFDNINGQMVSIVDMPGPNNSSDLNHKEYFEKIIKNKKFHNLIIYILDATNLAVDDDFTMLSQLITERKIINKNPSENIIFILNKADNLDIEAGENLEDLIASTINYLSKFDLESATIIPVASLPSFLFKKLLYNEDKSFTYFETKQLQSFYNLFQAYNFTNAPKYIDNLNEIMEKLEYKKYSFKREIKQFRLYNPFTWFNRFSTNYDISLKNYRYNSHVLYEALKATNIVTVEMLIDKFFNEGVLDAGNNNNP